MDADVYGPSIPHLLGLGDARPQAINRRLQPIEKDGLQVMSMGFIVPPGEAVVWRGPMLHGAITQFLRDTDWGNLDYLIIDMPPGTGDIALTLSQLLPLSGAVVVCTPQDVALLDASKAIAMFRKVNISILGIVENMSYFVCPDTGKRHDIFGSGGREAESGRGRSALPGRGADSDSHPRRRRRRGNGREFQRRGLGLVSAGNLRQSGEDPGPAASRGAGDA